MSAPVNVVKGDWFVVNGKYYCVIQSVALFDSNLEHYKDCIIEKTKEEYEAWYSELTSYAVLRTAL